MSSQVRCCLEHYSVLAIVFNVFFPFVKLANAGTAKWKLWRAKLEKKLVFTAAMALVVPKYIYGQYLYEQANTSIAKWKLWRIGLEK